MNNPHYKKWRKHFWQAFFIELGCYLAAPLIACFVRYEVRTDRVKIHGNKQETMLRQYLWYCFRGFQTHDNAVDEYFYGGFYLDDWLAKHWTESQYNTSAFKRWYCRLMWMWRNVGYGFLYELYGLPKEFAAVKSEEIGEEDSGEYWRLTRIYYHYFQIQEQRPITGFWKLIFKNHYISINYGWKAHKLMPNVLYANRVWTFPKKYKDK